MFDNLRDISDDEPTSFNFEDQQYADADKEDKKAPVSSTTSFPPAVRRRKKNKNFLGMNSQQRFLITVMLFFIVFLLGMIGMFVTGSMSLF